MNKFINKNVFFLILCCLVAVSILRAAERNDVAGNNFLPEGGVIGSEIPSFAEELERLEAMENNRREYPDCEKGPEGRIVPLLDSDFKDKMVEKILNGHQYRIRPRRYKNSNNTSCFTQTDDVIGGFLNRKNFEGRSNYLPMLCDMPVIPPGEIFRYFLCNEAVEICRNSSKQPPIVVAAGQHNLVTVTMLLEGGTDPNEACEVYRTTSLHAVFQQTVSQFSIDAIKIVYFLLKEGANPLAKNRQGKTPIDSAQEVMRFLAETSATSEVEISHIESALWFMKNIQECIACRVIMWGQENICDICTTAFYCDECVAKLIKYGHSCPTCRKKLKFSNKKVNNK